MFSSRSVQIAAVFSDVFGQALPILCRSFYNETKAEMFFSVFAVALLAEGVDRNLPSLSRRACIFSSPSSRRAWIEISGGAGIHSHATVALLAEGVDRNSMATMRRWFSAVALLAEGVDRNEHQNHGIGLHIVALLAEGVDRNFATSSKSDSKPRSPSSRRAWIEIISVRERCRLPKVALLAEGVDRNAPPATA